MKHLKLFESFDRHDFRKYTDAEGYDLYAIFNQLTIEDMPSLAIDNINKVFAHAKVLRNKDDNFYVSFALNRKSYLVYYLGDYVYYLGTLDNDYSFESIEIFDDINPLLEKLIELTHENEAS